MCVASSLGGVLNEVLLKGGKRHSLSLQNAILYGWGLPVNGVAVRRPVAMVVDRDRSPRLRKSEAT